MKIVKILQTLKPNDPLFKIKVKLLAQLIEDRDGGHIVDDRLLKWCDKVGIKTRLHCEDKTSWWSC